MVLSSNDKQNAVNRIKAKVKRFQDTMKTAEAVVDGKITVEEGEQVLEPGEFPE